MLSDYESAKVVESNTTVYLEWGRVYNCAWPFSLFWVLEKVSFPAGKQTFITSKRKGSPRRQPCARCPYGLKGFSNPRRRTEVISCLRSKERLGSGKPSPTSLLDNRSCGGGGTKPVTFGS